MRFRLRTLLIVLALGPMVLWIGWTKYAAWTAEQEQRRTAVEWLRYNHPSASWGIPTDE
jgi:hypothetical protein